MTQLSLTQRRTPATIVAGIALGAALLGGIVGNRVGAALDNAHGAPIVSARDQAVLQAARDWEARYRQMYPDVR